MAFTKSRHVDKKLSLMRVIRPVYLVISLFGLFPYSLKSIVNGGGTISKKSIYFNTLCGVSVLILVYAIYAIHVRSVFAATESNTMTEVLLTKLNYMMELTSFLVFCTVAYVCAFKYRLTYVKLLSAIVSSCNNFPDLTRNTIFRDLQGHVRLVMFFLCLSLVMSLVVNFTRNDSVWKMILVAFTFILPQTIQIAVISFYSVLLFVLSSILKNIDKNIRDIAKAKTVFSGCPKLEMMPFSLQQLEVAYIKVVEIKREINRALEACLFVTTFQCFQSLVSEAHIIYDGLTVNENFGTHDVCNCSIWIVYQVMKIYAITYSGTLLKEEEDNINRSLYNIPIAQRDTRLFLEVIHDYILHKSTVYLLINAMVLRRYSLLFHPLQVQHFSTVISNQTTEMTVYGYFVLDAKLMFNIIASASMYLVILVQFDSKS